MRVNDDLTKPIIVDTTKIVWVSSPAAGVDRRMLFRVGDEIARATSIVRYRPGSKFPRHVHQGGEEILVLNGTFQDEHGDYPAGTYFRNPPGTSHVPAAEDGCTIFVRLWQFRERDDDQIVRRPGEGERVKPRDGASKAVVLFDDGHEDVRIESWTAGKMVHVGNEHGIEFLVVSGDMVMRGENVRAQFWGRLPAGIDIEASIGPSGAVVWIRLAPLIHLDVLRVPN